MLHSVTPRVGQSLESSDERFDVGWKLDLLPPGQFPGYCKTHQQLDRRGNVSPPVFKSREVLRRHTQSLGERLSAQPELFSQEPDLGSPQRRRLPDQPIREKSVELLRVRDLHFLMPISALPGWRVDELNIVQPRLPVVRRRVDQPLRRPALSAPPRRPSASHLSESCDDGDPRPRRIERYDHGQLFGVQISSAHWILPVSELLVPRGLADMAGSQHVFDIPRVEVLLNSDSPENRLKVKSVPDRVSTRRSGRRR